MNYSICGDVNKYLLRTWAPGSFLLGKKHLLCMPSMYSALWLWNDSIRLSLICIRIDIWRHNGKDWVNDRCKSGRKPTELFCSPWKITDKAIVGGFHSRTNYRPVGENVVGVNGFVCFLAEQLSKAATLATWFNLANYVSPARRSIRSITQLRC